MTPTIKQAVKENPVAFFSAAFCFLTGTTVIVGWFTGKPDVVQIVPGLAGMQINTALGFMASGLGLAAVLCRYRWPVWLSVGWLVAVGGLTIAEYLFRVNLGIDRLIHVSLAAIENPYPGRMGANTATAFVAIGLALWLLNGARTFRKRLLVVNILAYGVLSLAGAVLLGYTTSLVFWHAWGLFTQMAVHTAISFVVLGVGVLFAVSHQSGNVDREEPASLLAGSGGIGAWSAWAVLAIALSLSGWAWFADTANVTSKARAEFHRIAGSLTETIEDRMEQQAEILYGGRGLFAASHQVERSEWHRYFETQRIDKRYPGTLAIGFSKRIAPAHLPGFIKHVRAQGFPDFTVWPAGKRAEYHSVIYLEPFDSRNRRDFGYDMFTESTRRTAMERARDGGEIAVSKKVTLVQETDKNVQPGFLMYAPVYRGGLTPKTIAARRDKLQGFVFAALRVDRLIRSVLEPDYPNVALRVFDGDRVTPESLLLDSAKSRGSSTSRPLFTVLRTIDVGGHHWTLQINSGGDFDAAVDKIQPATTLVAGIVISLLLFGVVMSIATTRARALTLAKEMVVKLDETRSRLAAVVLSSADAIITKTLDGVITSWNESAERIFGYTADEAIGQPIAILVPAGREQEEQTMMTTIRRGERLDSYETERRCKNGRIIAVSLSLSPIFDACGQIVGAAKIARDNTERQRAQEALARSNEELKQFAYIASHDLQEPLRIVSSYVQLLAKRYEGKLDAEADEFIGFAVDGTKRMRALINDLLMYSRTGRENAPLAPVNVQDVLTFSLENLQLALEETNARVTWDTMPIVSGNETTLRQLFQNLIGNALKYRGEDAPRIHIGARHAGSEWEFSIKDNGIGIDPRFFERIFQLFQRLHGKLEYSGTGIGLALCKKIVEQHNGRLWVTSTPGKGSTFYFTLQQTSG